MAPYCTTIKLHINHDTEKHSNALQGQRAATSTPTRCNELQSTETAMYCTTTKLHAYNETAT